MDFILAKSKLQFKRNIPDQLSVKGMLSEDLYDKNYRKNWWLDSSEIIKYGLADHVIENIEELF